MVWYSWNIIMLQICSSAEPFKYLGKLISLLLYVIYYYYYLYVVSFHALQSDFQCSFGECPQNHFTAFPGSRLPINWVKKDNQRSITGSMFSQMDNNELHWSNRNISRDPEFKHDYIYEYNQHMHKEIVQRLSSFVVSTIVFLGIFYNIWNSQLSIIHVPSLHKEHDGRLSVWSSLLGLFGFMMFVCAVAVMILVGAPFTSMQKAMLIFLAILMHLQSANSIIEVFVTLVGGLSMGWYSFGSHQMKWYK